jgi:UDP-glucose:(heptosyl)LPS alpha-1,3-glucosyltransferase
MKVSLVRRGYSASGGAERYLLRFARGLVDAGHQWTLFSDIEWPAELLSEHGGSQITLRNAGSPRAFAEAFAKAKPRDSCDCIFSLERVYPEDCDVFRAGDGVHAAWLERRAATEGRRLANWLRSRRRKHREILELEKKLYSGTARECPDIVTNSKLVEREIIERFSTPAHRIHCITNGYDAPHFTAEARAEQRQQKRGELGLDNHHIAALFTGSGWERKGLTDAITAVEALHGGRAKITLLVAGSGKTPTTIRHPDSIQFLGPIAASEMPALWEAADLFVLPTVYDPFSNASLEAAAHGLPVITTPANGFSELIAEQEANGSVVPVANPNALAAAIATWATLLTSSTDRSHDRDAIRQWAAQWSVEKNVRETLAVLYQRVT